MGASLAVPLHRRKPMGTRGQRDPAFRSGLTVRGRENAWCVSTCRVVVAELERSRRSPHEAKIEIHSDLREPGLAQSGKPRRAKRRRAAVLGGKTERSSSASSASVAQAMGDGVMSRPEQRRSRSGKLGALHGVTGGSDLGRGGIALTRKRVREVNRRDDGTSEADHERTGFADGKITPTHRSHGSPKRSKRREPLQAPRNAARKRETVAVTARTLGARIVTSVIGSFRSYASRSSRPRVLQSREGFG